jgi:hypothetical protein
MQDVFISYSHKDAPLVDRLRPELKKLGWSALDMREIQPGDDFRRWTQSAIKHADSFLVVITDPYSASSSWIGYELGAAEALGKPIVTLVSDRVPAAEIPEDLVSQQRVTFDPQAPERAAREIAGRLSAA